MNKTKQLSIALIFLGALAALPALANAHGPAKPAPSYQAERHHYDETFVPFQRHYSVTQRHNYSHAPVHFRITMLWQELNPIERQAVYYFQEHRRARQFVWYDHHNRRRVIYRNDIPHVLLRG